MDSEEEPSPSLQEIDMTVATDEAQGMPMAHNYDVFDGHAYFAEDVLDLQQYNGNLFFLLPFAENAQPSSVCRPAWNRLTLLPTPFSLPQFKVVHKGWVYTPKCAVRVPL